MTQILPQPSSFFYFFSFTPSHRCTHFNESESIAINIDLTYAAPNMSTRRSFVDNASIDGDDSTGSTQDRDWAVGIASFSFCMQALERQHLKVGNVVSDGQICSVASVCLSHWSENRGWLIFAPMHADTGVRRCSSLFERRYNQCR